MTFPRHLTFLYFLLIFITCAGFAAEITNQVELNIDADFPGGNIIVDKIEGNDIYLHQDVRDTKGDWFYWYFRARGAAGRSLTVHFTKSNVIGVRGPAVSLDEGETWSWLGKDSVEGQSFQYKVPDYTEEVRFCFAIPYLEADLKQFLKKYENNSHIQVKSLCQTRKGRTVERLHVGRLEGQCQYRVFLTCRHHACEMMANYVLEGIMETVLSETDEGQWFRDHVEFLIIPFVDKDGVEDGDQGKNRKPHDHNRDYAGDSIYPSVRAIRDLVPEWSEGKLRIALDMHCPYIRGPNNESLYFVGSQDQENWKRVEQFCEILEEVQQGPLVYKKEDNIPFGTAWNTAKNYTQGKSCGRWTSALPGIWFGTSIEIPYANVSGKAITAENARLLGGDIAGALKIVLDEVVP